jgi:GNAT superfamily N-acetyltransferase
VVARAETELVQRYGHLDETEQGLTATTFEPPVGVFLVARSEDCARPVGGVGLRRIGPPGTGEVKRLWVDPARRRAGLGRRVMGDLEDAARGMGLAVLRLDTGDRQPEAVALYESTGWERLHVDADGHPLPLCHIRFRKLLARSGSPLRRSQELANPGGGRRPASAHGHRRDDRDVAQPS